MSKGIANATVPEIEITPAMIEAGADAVHYGLKGPAGLEPDSDEEIAEAVYQAMERARRAKKA